MARTRLIVGWLLLAALLAPASAPMLACILPASAQPHGCCAPATAVQKDCGPGTQTCCTVRQNHEDPLFASARFEGARRQPVAAVTSAVTFGPTVTHLAAAALSDTSPPGGPPSRTSVLRI